MYVKLCTETLLTKMKEYKQKQIYKVNISYVIESKFSKHSTNAKLRTISEIYFFK